MKAKKLEPGDVKLRRTRHGLAVHRYTNEPGNPWEFLGYTVDREGAMKLVARRTASNRRLVKKTKRH